MFINFTPKPPQAFLKPVVNLILVILQNHSFIQFFKEIVSHFLLGLISFGPTTNIKITKPPFPYIISTICFSYMPFRLIMSERMDTTTNCHKIFQPEKIICGKVEHSDIRLNIE